MAENKCGDIYGQIESDPTETITFNNPSYPEWLAKYNASKDKTSLTININLIPSYPRSIYDSNWVHKMKEKKNGSSEVD